MIDEPVTSAIWITRKHVSLWDLPAGLMGFQLRVKTPRGDDDNRCGLAVSSNDYHSMVWGSNSSDDSQL